MYYPSHLLNKFKEQLHMCKIYYHGLTYAFALVTSGSSPHPLIIIFVLLLSCLWYLKRGKEDHHLTACSSTRTPLYPTTFTYIPPIFFPCPLLSLSCIVILIFQYHRPKLSSLISLLSLSSLLSSYMISYAKDDDGDNGDNTRGE